MRTDDFDFDLPRALIAQRPACPRDSARLLVVGDGDLEDRGIRDLPALLGPGDIMVFNDTRVIPARLAGRRGTAGMEVTLHKAAGAAPGGALLWRAFARPARKLHVGDRIDFAPGFAAQVAEKGAGGEVTLAFDLDAAAFRAALERHGAMPLPPYIQRPRGGDPADRAAYQTLFAARDGAVAAPTAGLHFTPELIAALDRRGIGRATVTLHVGAGTFLPVRAEDPRDHPMHGEAGEISPTAAETINAARRAGGRVVAVGSTALRLDLARMVVASVTGAGSHIFILPGTPIRAVDIMLTNFHLPRSTLFMLVSAFAGTAPMKAAYAHAIRQGYRFYSYGDACLLQREDRP
ncbi:MAG: tRNA preQ1(34) S-adenosylmethionine ribosyltransferase-isomerase QueA [Kiloniellaceae bacterium]